MIGDEVSVTGWGGCAGVEIVFLVDIVISSSINILFFYLV